MSSHERSKSTSSASFDLPPSNADSSFKSQRPPAISIPPRQRSMSTSVVFATSPIGLKNPSSYPLFGNTNNNTTAISPTSPTFSPPSTSNPPTSFGTTPPTDLKSFSNSIPASFGRRFSAGFTNPLNNHSFGASGSTGPQQEERTRRRSVFGSSPVSLQTINFETKGWSPTESGATTAHTGSDGNNGVTGGGNGNGHGNGGGGDAGGGGRGGIGGLFRKFSTSRANGSHHPFDTNESNPPFSLGHPEIINNTNAHQPQNQQQQQQQLGKDSRSSSPMRNMILNGQMLD
ncbi:hypothetical protein BX616_001208 [Lobosporangium transversale]|uniref:Uncharacterized protein n=1 Tax=Lobosporangium transversale TaxID=64571 RepID=A0A1Y2GW93_9FUNG|nr:hypothetical protein BCR41DRAFT_420279 [Lobosporangium transversale]KAF9904783.1 hypothetical protein BX616_001208 [Lobosporangium transversale]ORZ23704.1 hypothetical protein BCR41DRAFT_420279 [Lobosporangium transversale]|eukprot:XP_021883518.1 hypothetical protein BCR41DRAFT_420279 [Lobosporangium transversale]